MLEGGHPLLYKRTYRLEGLKIAVTHSLFGHFHGQVGDFVSISYLFLHGLDNPNDCCLPHVIHSKVTKGQAL